MAKVMILYHKEGRIGKRQGRILDNVSNLPSRGLDHSREDLSDCRKAPFQGTIPPGCLRREVPALDPTLSAFPLPGKLYRLDISFPIIYSCAVMDFEGKVIWARRRGGDNESHPSAWRLGGDTPPSSTGWRHPPSDDQSGKTDWQLLERPFDLQEATLGINLLG